MSSYKKALSLASYSKNVLNAQYAPRGAIITRSVEIRNEIERGLKFPFSELTELNVGNPHTFSGSKPVTFFREVLAVMMSPATLMQNELISQDVRNRAAFYLDTFKSMGSYTDSPGNPVVLKHIAEFITARDDGIKCDPANLFLTNGASEGIARMMTQLAAHDKVGFMVPVPQYPLYSAQVALLGTRFCGYYLDEDKNWDITPADLKETYDAAKLEGTEVRCIVVINPGNPTGQILDTESIQGILKFAHERNLMVFADEVYQDNIWANKKWVSFREVLKKMPAPYCDDVELVSFHSASKGFMGECGMRGGYVDLTNCDPIVNQMMTKTAGISLCSNTTGQVVMDLKVNPPSARMGESLETIQKYETEAGNLTASLKRRADAVTIALNQMENVSANPVEGSLYALAKIDFSDKFIAEAAAKNVAPDFLYCMKVLENTGCILVPGSGFYQKPGTHHFRTTILPLPEERFYQTFDKLKAFNKDFHAGNI